MTIRRRSLRKALVLAGCLVGEVAFPAAAIGGSLILVGVALHLWSKGCLEQNRRLTTAGPYRFTRNPFYLANLLIDLGLCFVIGRLWVAWVFLPIWWIAYRDTIAREEERLKTLFPDEFEAYRKAVPALLPDGRVWPRERVGGRFSLGNDGLARGAAYARVLGILIAPIALWAAESLRRNGTAILDGRHDLALAVCVSVPALWVWKLGLAETFRRPQTRLLPCSPHAGRRVLVVVLLAGVSGALLLIRSWTVSLPVFWLGLLALDALGEARSLESGLPRGETWRYFTSVAVVSSLVFAAIWLLGPAISRAARAS